MIIAADRMTDNPTREELLARADAIRAELKRRRLSEHTDIPEVFRPILRPARYKGLHGGRGSAKSHTFAELLVERCNRQPTRAVCIREFQVSLEQSVKRLIDDKIAEFGLQDRFTSFNNYIATPYDGIIIFNGMQAHTSDSIKSLEGYDVAWVEEAQSLSERSLSLLRPTIRKPGSELWFSWNPRYATDPVDVMLRPEDPTNLPRDIHGNIDAVVIGSSYKDNPHFPDVLRGEMEWDLKRDPDKYAHVWLGEYERNSEARVFKNWTVEAFDTEEIRKQELAKNHNDLVFYYGADWGFSVDPSVLVRCFFIGRTLYIDQEVFKVGVEIDHLPEFFTQVPEAQNWTITADSARPETISYLQRHGFPKMIAAVKGPNSVKEGVQFLQNFDVKVHPRCKETIQELTMYAFKVDKMTGLVMNVFEDKKNHIIDSLRYATEKYRMAPVREWEATW